MKHIEEVALKTGSKQFLHVDCLPILPGRQDKLTRSVKARGKGYHVVKGSQC